MALRKPLLLVVILSWSILAAAQAKPPASTEPQAPAPKTWDKLAFPKLGEVKVPDVKRYTLANGMKLFLVEDHKLPLIDGSAMIRTGSRWEPADKTGLASIFGQVLRTGGTRSKTGDKMDEELEAVAASVESSVSDSSGSANFSSVKGDEDKVLALFADMLMNPEFRQDKIDLAKVNERAGIARRNDDVGEIADREFLKILYGPASEYVRQTEYWTIDAVTRADLQGFHRRYYHPNNVMLSVWGDCDAESMKAKIEKAFASWQPAKLDLPPVPQVDAGRRASLNLIRKEDVNQTNLRVGHLGARYDDSEYFATHVMAQILGQGGLSSRIFRHIRTDMGLAYAAYAEWGPSYDHPGIFYTRVDTKSETTSKALDAILKEIRDIRQKEVTDEELKTAKEGILNSFVFKFQSVGQIVNRLMNYEYYGYPADFLQKYKANVEKVTKADVLRVAQRQLQPDQLAILAVGNDKEFDKPLEKIAYAGGKVNTIDIAILDAKPGSAAAPAASANPAAVQRGMAILANAQKFAGGIDKLRAVKDLDMKAKANLSIPQGTFDLDMRTAMVLPNISRSEVTLPFGTIISFFDGNTGWTQSPAGLQDMTEEQKKDNRGQVFRNLTNLLTGAGNPTVTFEKHEEDADVLLITKGDLSVRLHIDSSGKVLKKTYKGTTPGGPGVSDIEEALSDYHDIAGVQTPFKTVASANGKKYMETEITEVKANTGADPAKLGEKPK